MINFGESADNETTTTTEAYRISRYEFGRILGRNFRGLKRLQDIEFQDALNVSVLRRKNNTKGITIVKFIHFSSSNQNTTFRNIKRKHENNLPIAKWPI